MTPYWLLFILCALIALNSGRQDENHRTSLVGLVLFGILLTLMIGLRFEVGGDWGAYQGHFIRISYLSLGDVLAQNDPGYYALNWLSNAVGGDIRGVNLLCGLVFTCGLIAFCRTLPQPWVALVVAIPYLVIVVAMGYSRQGVAIGFAMLGLAAIQRGSFSWMLIWSVIAVPFHKTALILVPIIGLARTRHRALTFLFVILVLAILYQTFLESSVDSLVYGYLTKEYDSQGALIRVVMNAIPAALFLIFRKRFALDPQQDKVWRNIAFAALGCLPMLALSSSSTVIDRLALYFIPLQLFVFAGLASALGRDSRSRNLIVLGIIAYSAAIQFVWLTYASHANTWLPYRLYLSSEPIY